MCEDIWMKWAFFIKRAANIIYVMMLYLDSPLIYTNQIIVGAFVYETDFKGTRYGSATLPIITYILE